MFSSPFPRKSRREARNFLKKKGMLMTLILQHRGKEGGLRIKKEFSPFKQGPRGKKKKEDCERKKRLKRTQA